MTRISVTPAIAPAANWYWNGSASISLGYGFEGTFHIWGGHCGLEWGKFDDDEDKVSAQVGMPRNFPIGDFSGKYRSRESRVASLHLNSIQI